MSYSPLSGSNFPILMHWGLGFQHVLLGGHIQHIQTIAEVVLRFHAGVFNLLKVRQSRFILPLLKTAVNSGSV
jgi:hypothetical protein